jgi:hypothetical protein
MKNWSGRYDYITEPTLRVLQRLKDFNIKATFFIVSNIIDYHPGLVEKIVKEDHEIACHGLTHALKIIPGSKKPAFSRDEFENMTGRAKEKLEGFSNNKIIGYRAPGAYIGEWMFKSLIELGFKYDSSVYPNSFFNKTDMSLKKITSAPYVINNNTEKLFELPWPYFTLFNLRFPAAGGPFLRFMPSGYILKGIKNSLTRGATVFYFHSLDITYDKLPTLTSRNLKRPFYFMTSGKKTERKLITILESIKSSCTKCSEIINSIS